MCGEFVITINNNDNVSVTQSKSPSNVPQAYTVSSVDELPSNAMNGSLAMVKTNTWIFKDEPTFEGIAYNVRYYFNFSDASGQSYSFIEFLNQDYGVSANFIRYCNEGSSYTAYASQPVAWLTGGWDGDQYKTITITKEPTDELFILWRNQNAKQKFALYLRENGEWIYKSEIV